MGKLKTVDKSAPVICSHCKNEVKPYYFIKNKLFPNRGEEGVSHVRVELCGCPECKKVFITES